MKQIPFLLLLMILWTSVAQAGNIRQKPSPSVPQHPGPVPTAKMLVEQPSLGKNWQVSVSSVDGRPIPVRLNNVGYQGFIQFSVTAAPGIYFVKVRNLQTQQEVSRKLILQQ